MKTKLTITWKYNGEIETHTHTYRDVNAESVRLNNGYLWFNSETDINGWLWRLDQIVSMMQEVED